MDDDSSSSSCSKAPPPHQHQQTPTCERCAEDCTSDCQLVVLSNSLAAVQHACSDSCRHTQAHSSDGLRDWLLLLKLLVAQVSTHGQDSSGAQPSIQGRLAADGSIHKQRCQQQQQSSISNTCVKCAREQPTTCSRNALHRTPGLKHTMDASCALARQPWCSKQHKDQTASLSKTARVHVAYLTALVLVRNDTTQSQESCMNWQDAEVVHRHDCWCRDLPLTMSWNKVQALLDGWQNVPMLKMSRHALACVYPNPRSCTVHRADRPVTQG